MSAPSRTAATPSRLIRRAVARSSMLGLGLLVAAGTTPAAAVTPQDGEGVTPPTDTGDAEARLAGAPLNFVPAGNSDKEKGNQGNPSQGNTGQGTPGQGTPGQGTPGQGTPGQGNDDPGGDTPGDNTPGTNDGGHANGGTGGTTEAGGGDPADGDGDDDGDSEEDGDGDVVTPPLAGDFGTGKQFDLAVSTTGPVPGNLALSGAQFTFTPTSAQSFPFGEGVEPPSLPAPVTCTTDAAGTCTITGAFADPSVSGDGSDLVLPFGSYVVTQTTAIPGLAPASWADGDLSICFIGCDSTKPIAAPNASLFRQQVVATVVDGTGAVVADAEFTLDGPDFPRPPVDPADAGPTVPAAATSDSDGVLVFDGWFVPGDWTFTPTGTTSDGLPFLAETHSLVTTVAEAEAATPWDVPLVLAAQEATDEGDGTGDDDGTGDGDGSGEDDRTDDGDGDGTDGGDTDGAEGPGTEGPGRPVPGNPGTGRPVTPPVATGAPAAPSQAGDGVDSPRDDQPAGQAAPPTSAAPTTPSSRPTTSAPSSRTAPSVPPEFVLADPSPELQTVSFGLREAGFAAFGVVFLGAVYFGFLLFRRRARRQR